MLTVHNITMNQFITAWQGDLSFVGAAWDDIHNEYLSLRENKRSGYILDLMKEITYLQTKAFIVVESCKLLAVHYSRELVTEIKLVGCKGKFDFSDKATYSANLEAAIMKATQYKNQAARKEKELEDYQKKHGGTKVDRKEFDIWAVTLSKHNNFYVDFDIISPARFCLMMNEYDRYCEVYNAEHNNLIEDNGR